MPKLPTIVNLGGEGKGLFGAGGSLSNDAFGDMGGAVSDLFAARGARYKAAGDRAEQSNYLRSAGLADQNAIFTENSTAIKEVQAQRELFKATGGIQADVAGAGFAASGSALDILRDSAAQGSLTKAVIGEQGLITEAGYREQAASYRTMAEAAGMAAHAEDTASTGATVSGAIKGAAALAMLL